MFNLNDYTHLLKDRKNKIISLFEHACEIGFLTAPASSRYHLSHEGGLIKHSEHVLKIMLKDNEIKKYDLDEESILLVGLFHDVGKCGTREQPFFIPNKNLAVSKRQAYACKWHPSMGPWQEYELPDPPEYPFMNNPIWNHYPHALISLSTIAMFLGEKFTPEEKQAIAGHNGYFTKMGKEIMPYLQDWHKLTICVHHADVEATGIFERYES